MWVRPTPHIYSYNREASAFNSASALTSSSSTSSSATAESSRSLRARSEAVDRSEGYRASRATSLAPASGRGLVGYTGFYGRQLSLHRDAEEARRSESRASAAMSASRSSAAAAAASSYSAAASSSSAAASRSVSAVSRSTTTQQTTEKTSIQSRQVEEKRVSFKSQMDQSIKEGRQSMSRAVRRAEAHAETSGRDPRHVFVPRDTSDDILKKVADIHMAPYEGKEIGEARSAMAQGRVKIDRLERELEAITLSAMKYKSTYSKSASEMARQAMSEAESEAMASKTIKRTVVEESTRRQVA
jgi:hypothetical protein